MADANFGALIKKEAGAVYSVIGQVVSLEPPELISEVVESTNHSSAGYREYISGGLTELGEFKATINFEKTVMSGLYNDLTGGTVGNYEIDFPDTGNTVWKFSALVKSIKPGTADAQKPEVLQAEIAFQPTGALVLE